MKKMAQEEDRQSPKLKALDFLLDSSIYETFCDVENTNTDLTLGRSVHISEESDGNHESVSFFDVFDDNTVIPTQQSISFKSVEVPDSEFFDSDIGKKLLLQELESREKEFTLQNGDSGCAGCSSWSPCSRKKIADVPLLISDRELRNRQCISIGEYIGACSEPLGSLSDGSISQRPFFGCVTSTPITNRNRLPSSILDLKISDSIDFSKMNLLDENESQECFAIPSRAPTSFPVFLYTTPKSRKCKSYLEENKFYIGATSCKNIERLKAEERMKANKLIGRLPFDTLEADKTITEEPGYAYGNDSIADVTEDTTVRNLDENKEGSIKDKWTIEPKEVTLDSCKGGRVLLISNSDRNLKFKTKFDGKKVNICPLSGTIPAMGQIGLRILISQNEKKRSESAEDDVTIIIGSTEKNIHVKIIKQEKTSILRNRSFMLF